MNNLHNAYPDQVRLYSGKSDWRNELYFIRFRSTVKPISMRPEQEFRIQRSDSKIEAKRLGTAETEQAHL